MDQSEQLLALREAQAVQVQLYNLRHQAKMEAGDYTLTPHDELPETLGEFQFPLPVDDFSTSGKLDELGLRQTGLNEVDDPDLYQLHLLIQSLEEAARPKRD